MNYLIGTSYMDDIDGLKRDLKAIDDEEKKTQLGP